MSLSQGQKSGPFLHYSEFGTFVLQDSDCKNTIFLVCDKMLGHILESQSYATIENGYKFMKSLSYGFKLT